MRVTLRLAVLAGTLLVFGAIASAQNLIPNPGFDKDLSSWDPVNPVEWNSLDAVGSSHSGSAKISDPSPIAAFGAGLYSNPCFPISPAKRYSWGAKFFIPSGQTTAYAAVDLFYYTSADCSSGGLGGTSPNISSTTGVWKSVVNDNFAPPAGAHSAQFGAFVVPTASSTQPLISYVDDAFLIEGSVTAPCVADDTTLCLNGGRFKVTAQWRTHTDSGDGHAEALTSDTGTFWFFSSNNVELILKVVNACVNPFNRYWVFIAGLTNVEVTVTVVDTETGEVRTYVNPLDQAFLPIQDTGAFATCP